MGTLREMLAALADLGSWMDLERRARMGLWAQRLAEHRTALTQQFHRFNWPSCTHRSV